MALRTRSLDQAADKWARRASVAGPDYESGVRGAGGAWEAATKAAEDSWKQGVTQAAARGAFGKGVTQAGGSRWEQKAIEKGPSRFAQGVAVSQGDYTSRFGPFLNAISNLTLPPRGPSGDPRNLARVTAVAEALSKLKRR